MPDSPNGQPYQGNDRCLYRWSIGRWKPYQAWIWVISREQLVAWPAGLDEGKFTSGWLEPERFPMDAIVNLYRRAEHEAARRPSREEAEAAVHTLLRWAGENPDREGLLETPKRVVKAYEHLFKGYREDPADYLDKVFEEVEGYNEIVLVRDIGFHSHCEHHMVPFVGKAHIAYYPARGVVGLSKLARVVDTYARRLQTQE
eukprot:gene22136-23191_t